VADLSVVERLQKGTAPRELRIAVAEGLIPLDSNDLIKALNILSIDPDDDVKSALYENIPKFPRQFLLQITDDNTTSDDFLNYLSDIFTEDEEIQIKIILNRNVKDVTLLKVAGLKIPAVLSLLSGNKRRMFNCPELIYALLDNSELPRIDRFSLLEFKENWIKTITDRDKIEDEVKFEIGTERLEKADDIVAVKDETAPITEVSTDEISDDLLADDLDEIDAKMSSVKEPSQQKPSETAVSLEDPTTGWDLVDLVEDIEEEEKEELDWELDFEDIDDSEEILRKEKAESIDKDSYDGWEEFDDEDSIQDAELDDEIDQEDKIEDNRMRLMNLSASEKLLVAKMGSKQERAILVRDPNKKVAIAVVQSPKLSEFEAILIATNRSVHEDVLREIYLHGDFGKSPAIRKELVLNPKTPLSVSLKLLNKLNDFALKDVSKSKEIPYGLTANAKRLYQLRESRRQKRSKA